MHYLAPFHLSPVSKGVKVKRKKQHKPASRQAFLKPKQATGGPVRVIDPEAEERRLIQKLRQIAQG
jgi:hypothetical protein